MRETKSVCADLASWLSRVEDACSQASHVYHEIDRMALFQMAPPPPMVRRWADALHQLELRLGGVCLEMDAELEEEQ